MLVFDDCNSLTYHIKDNLMYLGNGTNPCLYLTGPVNNDITTMQIAETCRFIEKSAFYGCSKLEKVSVAAGNSKYHSAGNCLVETETKTLILGCKNSVIPADGSVTFIGDGAFNRCSGLTNITIPNGVKSIGDHAFSECSSLISISIPDSVETIGVGAFYLCSTLTSVTIGNKVTSIGWGAFWHCSGLKAIYYCGTAEDWNKLAIGSDNDKLTSATRYYYSETQPTESGNYWHYNKNGEIEEWQ